MRRGYAKRSLTWGLVCGALTLAAACVIEEQRPQPPPARPAPPPPAQHVAQAPALPRPAPVAAPAPAPMHHEIFHFAGRIVHPPPAQNAAVGTLDVHALRLRLRPKRTCGPRESTPGHWIHIDCNAYSVVTTARPFSPRKLQLILGGQGRIDAPIQAGQDIDHRNDGTEGPIKDQGQVGSCTAFSLSTAMDNAIRRQNKSDTTSSLHLWAHYGFPDMRTAGDGNLNKVIAVWGVWPYDERIACELDQSGDGDCGPYSPAVVPGAAGSDPQVQAKIKDSDSKGSWKVSAYDEIDGSPDTLAQYLATGADVWLSMNIGSTWFTVNGDTIADWTAAQVEGGHAIVLAGVRHKNGQRQFLVHNSWGSDWGDKGYAWISEGTITSFIKQAYKVTVVDTAAPPRPAPLPLPIAPASPATPPPSRDPNALTDDDCAENQLVDSVTGQCANMCPDDSRPASGVCDGGASAKRPPVPAPVPLKVQIHH
jgi:hypothetical protein